MLKARVWFECSEIVTQALRARGIDAYSVDLKPSEIPGYLYHIQCDVRNDNLTGVSLLIAHPDCTHLAVSGARWWPVKLEQQKQSIEMVMFVASRQCQFIAIENPIGKLSTAWRKPDQIIQPWQFGHGEVKATCLWLKNLPLLKPSNIVAGRYPRVHLEPPGPNRKTNRSRTYQGIAEAIANQWGKFAATVPA